MVLGDLRVGQWGYLPMHYTAARFDGAIATHERGSLLLRLQDSYILYDPDGFCREEHQPLDFDLLPAQPIRVTPHCGYRDLIIPASALRLGQWGMLENTHENIIKLEHTIVYALDGAYREYEESFQNKLFVRPAVTELNYEADKTQHTIKLS